MIRTKSMPMAEAIMQTFRLWGLETPLLEYRVTQAWPAVMGEAVARYTSEVYVRGGMLHVRLKSPALKQNLLMMHSDIARRLNHHVGAQVITDVRFL